MRQFVKVIITEDVNLAEKWALLLSSKLKEEVIVQGIYATGEYAVSLFCDPELEFFRVDKYLEKIKKLLPEAEVIPIGLLNYEPDYVECKLCGERYGSGKTRCDICHAPNNI